MIKLNHLQEKMKTLDISRSKFKLKYDSLDMLANEVRKKRRVGDRKKKTDTEKYSRIQNQKNKGSIIFPNFINNFSSIDPESLINPAE